MLDMWSRSCLALVIPKLRGAELSCSLDLLSLSLSDSTPLALPLHLSSAVNVFKNKTVNKVRQEDYT